MIDIADKTGVLYVSAADSSSNPCLTNNGGCEQTCQNNNGFVVCGCNAGYQLHSNGTNCVGKSS